jgi:large subunit ribosomal protein L4
MADAIMVPVRSQANEPTGEMELTASIFGGPVRRHLLYETVRMQRANRRAGTAATRTRGFTSGGGNKPWRQKGTGRARAGSSRSPIWVGGATVFGPQPRDYSYRIPRSARKSALRSVLALKAREGRLIVLEDIVVEPAKTKTVATIVAGLGVTKGLIITGSKNEALERAARNLPKIKVLRAEGANVYDILRHQHLILTRAAIEALEGRLAS